MAASDHRSAPAPEPSEAVPSGARSPIMPRKRSGLGIEIPDIAGTETHTINSRPRINKKMSLCADKEHDPADLPVSSVRSSYQSNQTTAAETNADSRFQLPPVRVLMPTVCDCGAPIVGCWYRKKAHWCEWFRHQRYEPLRSQLVLQRSKSSRDRNSSSTPFTPSTTSPESDNHYRPPQWSKESFDALSDELGPPCSPSEVLGPDPLSVLCLTQFLKHKKAVQTAYCADPTAVSSFPMEQLKMHVDCRNAKSYVHFRWYSNSIMQELVQKLSSPHRSDGSPSIIGCINIQHWNKKQPKAPDSLPRSSKELVELGLKIEKVFSTFQVVPPDQASMQVETSRRPDRSTIHTWSAVDDMIWTVAFKLGVVPLDVIKQCQSVAFPAELARSDNSWTSCNCKSDRSPIMSCPTASVNDPTCKSSIGEMHTLPEVFRPSKLAMNEWLSTCDQLFEFSWSHTSSELVKLKLHGSCDQFDWGSQSASLNVSSDVDAKVICFPSKSAILSAPGSNHSFGPTTPRKVFCVNVRSASIPDSAIEDFLNASTSFQSRQVVGLFFSIGSFSVDQTVVVTNCINAIQSSLQNILQYSRSDENILIPRVYVSLVIQGQFSEIDCHARICQQPLHPIVMYITIHAGCAY